MSQAFGARGSWLVALPGPIDGGDGYNMMENSPPSGQGAIPDRR